MPFENGEYWQPIAPSDRGRYATFSSAVSTVFRSLVTERNDFFESLADRWANLFPGCPAVPDRYEDGKVFLRVRSASALFSMRAKLPKIRRTLAALPDAPRRIELWVEIHSR